MASFRSPLLLVVVFSSCLLPWPRRATAGEAAPLTERVTVTATLVPEEEPAIGSAVTVIRRDRIEASGAETVAEALRMVPGLDIVRSGDEGAVTTAFVRGAASAHVLVLVDGVRANSPYWGGYDFSAMTTENVERIEVVRGPVSALYGSDALGGVIQVFTRKPGVEAQAEAALEAGSAGRRGARAFGSTADGPIAVAASARDLRVDGDRGNSDWRTSGGSIHLRLRTGERYEAALEAATYDGEGGIPGPEGLPTPRARGTFREQRVSIPVAFEPAGGHLTRVVLAQMVSSPGYSNPDDPFGFTFSSTRARVRQVTASDAWRTARQALTTLLSWEEWEVTDRNALGVTLDGRRTRTWGAAVQETVRLSRGGSASVGARYDRHDEFGSAFSPRATVAWLTPDSRWKVRASAGSAFRAPTLGELYYPGAESPGLRPERSTSYEIGIERYLARGAAEVSLFWNDFRDLIQFRFDAASGIGRNENVGLARTRGAEVSWRRDFPGVADLSAGFTLLDAEDRVKGGDLLRRPAHRAFAAATFRPAVGTLLTLEATFVGARPDVDPVSYAETRSPSYSRLDLFARYERGRVLPFLRLENLGNRRYQEASGYPCPGRRVALGLEVRL